MPAVVKQIVNEAHGLHLDGRSTARDHTTTRFPEKRMSTHLPWSLLATYSILVGAIFVQQDTVRRTEFLGRPMAPMPLQTSAALGGLAAIGTLIHFFVATPWYWAFALLALSSLVAATASAVVRLIVGDSVTISLSYVAWPIFAIWSNMIIADLPG